MRLSLRSAIVAAGVFALTGINCCVAERWTFQPLDLSRPGIVSLGDLDGDQQADVVSVDGSVVTLELSKTRANPERFQVSGGGYITVAAIDIDHDGDLDLVVSTSAQVSVFVNNGR